MPKDEISNDPVAIYDSEEALWKVQRSISQADLEKHGGSGSRNLDQPKGDETHLMMKTTAACMLVAEVG
ncbi:hypothetical protein NC651_036230 [Populus alba x Populus x berolinensis]|nr:hypothetical protein NC651_036230 [Populus alba x Populus x berolinensis]